MAKHLKTIKSGVSSLLLLFFCFADIWAVVPDSLQQNYDVKHYHISVQASDTTTFIKATTQIGIELLDNSDSLFFDFGSQLDIEEVSLDGKSVVFQHVNNKLIITDNLSKGQQSILSVKYYGYGGFPEGDEAVINKEYEPYGSFTYTLTEPYSTKYWYPCKEVLTDKADSVFIDILVPEGMMAGSVGTLVNTVSTDTGWIEYQWRSYYPTAFYLISFALGNFLDYTFTYNGIDTFPVVNYIYNSEEFLEKEKSNIDTTKNLLDVFSELFGPYPFSKEKYGHCLVPVGGGMEHQTMTTLGNFGFSLVGHELAHQWFGNYVTCSSWNHIWINEGFASYAEYLSLEMMDSKESAVNWMEYAHELAINSPEGRIYVPDDELEDDKRVFNYNTTYKKGAAILHMLRHEINDDDLFFAALRAYLLKFKFANASADDFRDHMENYCGIDLSTFFNQWYYGTGYPIFDIEWYQLNDELVIIAKQRTSDSENTPFFNLKLPVYVEFPDGDTTVTVVITEQVTVCKIKMQRPVYSIVVNPENTILTQVNSVNRVDSLSTVQLRDLLLFPNPAGDAIKVFSTSQHQPLDLYFYTTNGKLVKSIKDIIPDGSEHSISDLNAGLYLVSISVGKEQAFLKLIKS